MYWVSTAESDFHWEVTCGNKAKLGICSVQNSDGDSQYVKFANELKDMVKRGFSAAVYTQTTDVEGRSERVDDYDRKM